MGLSMRPLLLRLGLLFLACLTAPILIPTDASKPDYYAGLAYVKIDGKAVSDILGPILSSYEFSLPESALRKGTGYVGANFRLRKAVRDMLSGKRPVKIGIVGSSVSAADIGPSQKGVTDWSSLLATWASTAFMGHNVTVRNGAIAGTTSATTTACLDRLVDPDVDIIFSEFVYDDGFDSRIVGNEKTSAYERLVRRMLSLPSKPAVIMMQAMAQGGAHETSDQAWKPFHITQEDVLGALSQYYDIQWLSFRDATYRLTHKHPTPGLMYKDLMAPGRHLPGDAGHKVLADLAVWLLQQTALDLAMRPFDHADVEQGGEPVPPPMIPLNEVPADLICQAR